MLSVFVLNTFQPSCVHIIGFLFFFSLLGWMSFMVLKYVGMFLATNPVWYPAMETLLKNLLDWLQICRVTYLVIWENQMLCYRCSFLVSYRRIGNSTGGMNTIFQKYISSWNCSQKRSLFPESTIAAGFQMWFLFIYFCVFQSPQATPLYRHSHKNYGRCTKNGLVQAYQPDRKFCIFDF